MESKRASAIDEYTEEGSLSMLLVLPCWECFGVCLWQDNVSAYALGMTIQSPHVLLLDAITGVLGMVNGQKQ